MKGLKFDMDMVNCGLLLVVLVLVVMCYVNREGFAVGDYWEMGIQSTNQDRGLPNANGRNDEWYEGTGRGGSRTNRYSRGQNNNRW
jgi:hypothetical protein